MQTAYARLVDATKILTRRELAAVLADLRRKSPRSPNTRLNRVIFRLAACCGLRATEIARLHVSDVRVVRVELPPDSIYESVSVPSREADCTPCPCGGMPGRWKTWPLGSGSGWIREQSPTVPLSGRYDRDESVHACPATRFASGYLRPRQMASAFRWGPSRREAKLSDPLGDQLPKRSDALVEVEPQTTSVLDHTTARSQHRLLEAMQIPAATQRIFKLIA